MLTDELFFQCTIKQLIILLIKNFKDTFKPLRSTSALFPVCAPTCSNLNQTHL